MVIGCHEIFNRSSRNMKGIFLHGARNKQSRVSLYLMFNFSMHKNMRANNFSNMVAQALASYVHWLADKKEKLSSEEQYPYQA